MEPLNRAYSQMRDLFRSMTPGSRLMIGLLGAVVLSSLIYLGMHQTSSPEVDLMHGVPVAAAQLPTMEAAFYKAHLTDYKIQGTSIRVPQGQESAYMAALAEAKALPLNFGDQMNLAGSDDNPFMSNAQRELRMKIVKQTEMSLAINAMPGIERAYVLYDIDNKPGGFNEKVITATANVKPVGDGQLDEARVSAIRHSICGAIAGLKPENVTVSDLNGPTWYGNIDESAGTEENLRLSLKRTYEQDLKAKILNALCLIPNVAVEVSVTIDRGQTNRPADQAHGGMAPTQARVSIGVPGGYYKKVWRQCNADDAQRSRQTPTAAELDRITAEESAKIQRHVAQLLPAAADTTSPADSVTVTTFQDVPDKEQQATGLGRIALNWISQQWIALGWIALGLAGLLALRSIVRAGVGAARAADADKTATRLVGAARSDAPSSHIPPPHWRRPAKPAETPLHEELSQLVENDPEKAASILRHWIGQVN